jgi:hypothetical protein
MKEKYWLKMSFKNDVEDDSTDIVCVAADSEIEAKEEATRGLENVTVEIVGKPRRD